MRKHVQVLGILNIVWGGLYVFGALVILLVFGGVAGLVGAVSHDPDAYVAVPILTFFAGALALLLVLLSVPSIVTGVGLLKLTPWSRILGIVVSALHILSIPFGTALGVYGLWVLLSNETVPLFARPLEPWR